MQLTLPKCPGQLSQILLSHSIFCKSNAAPKIASRKWERRGTKGMPGISKAIHCTVCRLCVQLVLLYEVLFNGYVAFKCRSSSGWIVHSFISNFRGKEWKNLTKMVFIWHFVIHNTKQKQSHIIMFFCFTLCTRKTTTSLYN